MQVQENITLAPYTTLKVGGPARYLVEVDSVEMLQLALQFAAQAAVPALILGAGSNVLFADQGYEGLVIINKIAGTQYIDNDTDGVLVVCGAGEDLDAVVAETVARGYIGLENLSHIPGTVGATPVQNVGAYGVEVADRIIAVQAVNVRTGEKKEFTNQACQFAYRDSYFKSAAGREWVITTVTFALSKNPSHLNLAYADLATFAAAQSEITAQAVRDEIIRIRSGKFPDWHTIGTAGSFFKNPFVTPEQLAHIQQSHPDVPHFKQSDGTFKIPLGWILDKVCNLKGYTQGKVGLYEHQALVLINHGDSADAVTALVTHVTQLVADKTGIAIEPEVRIV